MENYQYALPVCKHPIKILLIDDNLDHLELYQQFLGENGIQTIAMSNPKKALEYLNQRNTSNYWEKFAFGLTTMIEANKISSLDSDKLWTMIGDLSRFDDVGVACIDKQMPELDGIDLLKHLRNHGVKAILMTGYHDTNDVIDAMKNGLIVSYVQKHDDEAEEILVKCVRRAEHLYFSHASAFSGRYMPLIGSVLNNKDYCQLHHGIQQQYNIIEYYMCDPGGSYLMLDKDGQGIILALIHPAELEAYDFELGLSDIEPTQAIIDAVKSRKQAPFFLHIDRHDITPDQWGDYLVNIKPVPNSDLYYAIIDNVERYGFDLSKVKSYSDYLAQQ